MSSLTLCTIILFTEHLLFQAYRWLISNLKQDVGADAARGSAGSQPASWTSQSDLVNLVVRYWVNNGQICYVIGHQVCQQLVCGWHQVGGSDKGGEGQSEVPGGHRQAWELVQGVAAPFQCVQVQDPPCNVQQQQPRLTGSWASRAGLCSGGTRSPSPSCSCHTWGLCWSMQGQCGAHTWWGTGDTSCTDHEDQNHHVVTMSLLMVS